MNIGARIKLARNKKQMPQRELGQKVNVSATAISKFERNLITPRPSTLVKLAKALDVSMEYFFQETPIYEIEPTYRKKSTLSKKEEVAITSIVAEKTEHYLSIENCFPKGFFGDNKFPSYPVYKKSDVEQAAASLRQTWQLGTDPLPNLTASLEDRGIKIFTIDASTEFDGLSYWINDTVPVIVLNNSLLGDRQRFTLGHEVAHLLLVNHSEYDDDVIANHFAGAFLIPGNVAKTKLGIRRGNLSFNELLVLKKEYSVSIQTWIRRAYALDIIPRSVYVSLFRQLSAKGWRTKEPEPLYPEKPRRLELLVEQALTEHLITPSEAAQLRGKVFRKYLSVSPNELEHSADQLAPIYAEDRELTLLSDTDFEEELSDEER